MARIIRLTERDLTRLVRRVINESSDSSCLSEAGFTRESIGGPMTRSMVYEKTSGGVTYQIGIEGNDSPKSELKIIKNNSYSSKPQYCSSWSCDSSSTIGIKYSGCKTEGRSIN
jgi:hypothetical protein